MLDSQFIFMLLSDVLNLVFKLVVDFNSGFWIAIAQKARQKFRISSLTTCFTHNAPRRSIADRQNYYI